MLQTFRHVPFKSVTVRVMGVLTFFGGVWGRTAAPAEKCTKLERVGEVAGEVPELTRESLDIQL